MSPLIFVHIRLRFHYFWVLYLGLHNIGKLHVELVGLGSSSSMDSFASWKMNGSRMEKEEREETPLQREEAHHHRRPWIRAWRKKEMNDGRGREEHEILCSKRALKSEV